MLALHSLTRSTGWHRSVTCVSTPMVPRLPTSSRGMSKPLTFLTVGPPPFTTSPFAFTKRTSSTRSRRGPCRSRRYPDNPVAIMPPTVAWSDRGFSAHSCACVPSTSASSASVVPAPTVTVRSAGSYAMTPAGARTATASARGGFPTSRCVPPPTAITASAARTASASSSTAVVTAIRSTRLRVPVASLRSDSRSEAPSAGWRDRQGRTRRATSLGRRDRPG